MKKSLHWYTYTLLVTRQQWAPRHTTDICWTLFLNKTLGRSCTECHTNPSTQTLLYIKLDTISPTYAMLVHESNQISLSKQVWGRCCPIIHLQCWKNAIFALCYEAVNKWKTLGRVFRMQKVHPLWLWCHSRPTRKHLSVKSTCWEGLVFKDTLQLTWIDVGWNVSPCRNTGMICNSLQHQHIVRIVQVMMAVTNLI